MTVINDLLKELHAIEPDAIIEFEGVTIEFTEPKEYLPGKDVRLISDEHLQNARRLAYYKLKEYYKTTSIWAEVNTPMGRVKDAKLAWYRNMYTLCNNEVHRRFMRAKLISIPEELGQKSEAKKVVKKLTRRTNHKV